MVTVPTLDKKLETRPIPSGGFSNSLSLPQMNEVKNTGFAELGKAVTNVADDIHKDVVERANTTALLGAQKQLDDWEATNLFDPKTGAYSQKGKNAFDLPNKVIGQYDKDMQAIRENLTGDQQLAFDKMAISRRGNIAQSLLTHERSEMDSYRKSTAEGAAESAMTRAALNANDEKTREASVTNAVDSMRAYFREQGLDGPALDGELAKVEGKARLGVLTKLADENPRAAVDFYHKNEAKFGPDILSAQRVISTTDKTLKATDLANNALGQFAPKTNKDDIIGYIVGPQIEGGPTVAKDGKGIAKFGINSTANPTVPVADLSEDDAKKIASEKYWDNANGLLPPGTLDKLPPQMRLVVFDRVFNGYDQRVLNKPLDQLIKESNGDPKKFLEFSQEYLQQVAIKNPEEHAKDLPGWNARIAKLRTQVDAMYGTPPTEAEVFANIEKSSDNPEIVQAAKTLAKKQIDERNSAINDGYKKAADEAGRYQLEGKDVPPSVIARMEPNAASAMQAKQYDPMTYERARNQVAYGQPVDLDAIRFKMTPAQFEELRKTQTNAPEQAVMRSVDKNINDNIRAVIGKKAATEAGDFARLDSFRKLIYNDIEDMRAKKIAVDDDAIEKVVDRQIKKNSGGLFSNGGYDVKKIPENHDYFVGGQKVTYPQLISSLSDYAQKKNIPVTDENLAAIYTTLKGKKLIKEQ